ncbi:hypothetical protein [Streptomyces spinoverrucosus]|uniref:hypothetical protein n=1 Tax=Streptomyces spinoverrucosus TaxID=284043 RepID=UPI001E48CE3A|nr:hypothetical protein [Streptomyces spinoverrucosus]
MKIFDLAGTAHGHWNNVVELQFRSSATHSATTLIAYPHELFDVVRYVPALADARLFTHGNHGSRPVNALTFPLVPSEQQGMDIVAVHVVIRPIEPVFESPVPMVACEDHEDRFMSLQLLLFEIRLFTDDAAGILLAPDPEPRPAHGGRGFLADSEQPRQGLGAKSEFLGSDRLESDGYVVGTAQHDDSDAWRNKRATCFSNVTEPDRDDAAESIHAIG